MFCEDWDDLESVDCAHLRLYMMKLTLEPESLAELGPQACDVRASESFDVFTAGRFLTTTSESV